MKWLRSGIRPGSKASSLMMVNLPREGYWDSREGRLVFYLVAVTSSDEHLRTSVVRDAFWRLPGICVSPKIFARDAVVGACLFIGSVAASPCSEDTSNYFCAEPSDLTLEGGELLKVLTRVYESVSIVTLLDTD